MVQGGVRPKTPLGQNDRSPGPDGEVSRRDRRGFVGNGEGSCIGAVFCNYLGFQKRFLPKSPPKKDWIRALTLYSPFANSKTPPRLCASARGSPDGNGESRLRKRFKLQARSRICAKVHISMRQVREAVKAGGVRGTGCGRALPARHSGLRRGGGTLGPPRWWRGSRGRGGRGRRCGPGSPCPPGSGCRRR